MNQKYNALTPEEERVIIDKGTEKPFSGKYTTHVQDGVYVCKRCDAELYLSAHKFPSSCGWPSFDDEIPGAIRREIDADGRPEIVCSQCDGHLGHVFEGEHLTPKNIRHCVNSISMNFMKKAYFAGGCFWGIEHLMQQQNGVSTVVSGYMGGHVEHPTYNQVCQQATGHVEAVEVLYDPTHVTYETLAKLFFEIHDPTQHDGQGPDKGSQYASVIFYNCDEEKKIAECLIKKLIKSGLSISTKIMPSQIFWKAEESHQNYYEKHHQASHCHRHQKRFFDE